jgi:hypothetical protein
MLGNAGRIGLLLVFIVMSVFSRQGSDSTTSRAIAPPDNLVPAKDTVGKMQSDTLLHPGVGVKAEPAPVAPPQTVPEATPPKTKKEVRRSYCGIGLSLGTRIIVPDEINKLINDLWDDMQSGYFTSSTIGSQDVYTASVIDLKVPVFPLRSLELQPNGKLLYAWKIMMLSGAASKTANVFLADYSAGFDVYGHFTARKVFTAKLGGGIDYHWTSLTVSGDEGDASLSGSGIGLKVGLGLCFTFSRVAITLDFAVPFTTIALKVDKNNLIADTGLPSTTTIQLPHTAQLTGFEIRPGLVIRF